MQFFHPHSRNTVYSTMRIGDSSYVVAMEPMSFKIHRVLGRHIYTYGAKPASLSRGEGCVQSGGNYFAYRKVDKKSADTLRSLYYAALKASISNGSARQFFGRQMP